MIIMGKENENGSRGLAFVGFSYARKERLWPIGRSPKKPCAYPGCARLTDKRYCPEHEKLERDRYNKYERSPDINKKYGRAWKRIRDRYVKEHPLCEMCLKEGRLTPVEEVHHIKPISQGGTHARSNLMSLCQSCHTKIHHEIGDR
jgi:5-methylcytosine-specific restriction protein A